MASTTTPHPDTPVTLKVNLDGSNRRFKLPLRDLGASSLPDKLRFLLSIPPTSDAVFERYSDSAAAFVVLDPNNASVYKQLYRAAKAKLKLRIRVTITGKEQDQEEEHEHEHQHLIPKPATVEDEEPSPVSPVDALPAFPDDAAADDSTPPPPSAVNYAQQAGSVADIQRGIEELLIKPSSEQAQAFTDSFQRDLDDMLEKQARFSTKCAVGSTSSAASPPMSACPYMLPQQNEAVPKNATTPNNGIPVTRGAAARDKWFAELASVSHERQNALRGYTNAPPPITSVFSVYCNSCGGAIPDEHYHCSTCDDGDFDLCQACVNAGVLCGGEEHWMIKRFVKNGKVINSTTETIAPKPKALFSDSKTTLVAPEETKITAATRTCNCCIEELPEDNFVTCMSCDDYDLCLPCLAKMDHGHHPRHAFMPAVGDVKLEQLYQTLLAPGRNVGHNAVCDGCDKFIYGVRHKCLDCPDWDFCQTCLRSANFIHPGHRFVPIYEPLNDHSAVSRAYNFKARHLGIYCDGPLCTAGNGVHSYIRGDRYKCAVCHDTDFCANCEANPSNPHNKTHPLIKFKSPVRNVSVTTMGDHEDGKPLPVMGDRRQRTTSKATETTPTTSTNAATQVRTVADLKPEEPAKAEETPEETHEAEAEVEPKTEKVKELAANVAEEDLVAYFVRDVIADGTILPPNCVFEQTWYLRNGGTSSWPAGCCVKFVGGDNMCAVDPEHPASVHELVSAAESTTCYTEVAPGQLAGFTVLMRTPNREGNFISYWRLTGPDGGKFGHRLWCDVNVKAAAMKEGEVIEPKAEKSEGSQMIFPKLEKESPATSIHQEAPSATPVTRDEADECEDFVEEALSDETEDGFLTDEEYDILDASDEEYLAEQGKAVKK